MEEVRDVVNRGVTVVRPDAPSNYHVALRTEGPSSTGESTAPAPPSSVPPPQPLAMVVAPAATTMPVKKKRGRPRKYGPDGSVTTMAPSPSSAPPAVIDFSAGKRGKVRPASSVHKAKFEVENLGEWAAGSVGTNFTPHIITINSGEAVFLERPLVISAKVGHAWDLPENTFGAAYARFMGSRNFSPDDRPPVRFMDTDELAYVAMRAREIHDFWHTLFSLPTNLIGESALKVIEFEQMYLPMCLLCCRGHGKIQ